MSKKAMTLVAFTFKAFRYFQLRQKWIGNGRGSQAELDEMRKLDAELMRSVPDMEAPPPPPEGK